MIDNKSESNRIELQHIVKKITITQISKSYMVRKQWYLVFVFHLMYAQT